MKAVEGRHAPASRGRSALREAVGEALEAQAKQARTGVHRASGGQGRSHMSTEDQPVATASPWDLSRDLNGSICVLEMTFPV